MKAEVLLYGASMSMWDKHLMFQDWKNTSWIIFLPLFFSDSLWFKELKPPALLNLAHCDYPHGSPWVYLNFTLENFSCICVLRYIFQNCSPQVLQTMITKLYPWFSIELSCFSFLFIFNTWLILNSSHYLALFLTQT